MKKQEYAIVDIETTGGNAQGSRITEIAIIIHDGTQVLERWETLVNPEQEIPIPIFALTGIDNEMVRDAPVFERVAPRVYEMLSNRVFVAHNVNFDYSFVRHQLEEAGWNWSARKLCTVRAARKIKPGLKSYSLGNLCDALQISIENRHRAGGDAEATAVLFGLLVEWDTTGILNQMIKNTAQDQRLPPNVPIADFEQLPEKPGIYYFYNQQQQVVYIGKAVNIKKRVASHFSGHKITAQRQHFLRDLYGISFEVCASELMALLLECIEIRKLWPIYNKALKRFEAKYGLYTYQARNGYSYLAVGKVTNGQQNVEVFNELYLATNFLRSLAQTFELDYRFCKYGVTMDQSPVSIPNTLPLPEVELHNAQVDRALKHVQERKESYYIMDKGKTKEEYSCIWVENGHFYGMGAVPVSASIEDPLELKNYLVRYPSNQYMLQLVQSFSVKYPHKVHRLKGLV